MAAIFAQWVFKEVRTVKSIHPTSTTHKLNNQQNVTNPTYMLSLQEAYNWVWCVSNVIEVIPVTMYIVHNTSKVAWKKRKYSVKHLF